MGTNTGRGGSLVADEGTIGAGQGALQGMGEARGVGATDNSNDILSKWTNEQ